jgi:hypothetical protein
LRAMRGDRSSNVHARKRWRGGVGRTPAADR